MVTPYTLPPDRFANYIMPTVEAVQILADIVFTNINVYLGRRGYIKMQP
jgi:hypothetical protein